MSRRRVSLGLNPVSATLGCFAPLMLSALVCTEVTLMAAAMRGGDGGARGCKRPGAQCVCVCACVHACARVCTRVPAPVSTRAAACPSPGGAHTGRPAGTQGSDPLSAGQAGARPRVRPPAGPQRLSRPGSPAEGRRPGPGRPAGPLRVCPGPASAGGTWPVTVSRFECLAHISLRLCPSSLRESPLISRVCPRVPTSPRMCVCPQV